MKYTKSNASVVLQGDFSKQNKNLKTTVAIVAKSTKQTKQQNATVFCIKGSPVGEGREGITIMKFVNFLEFGGLQTLRPTPSYGHIY